MNPTQTQDRRGRWAPAGRVGTVSSSAVALLVARAGGWYPDAMVRQPKHRDRLGRGSTVMHRALTVFFESSLRRWLQEVRPQPEQPGRLSAAATRMEHHHDSA